MALPAGYRLRAPAPGDLDAVADVLIADELGEAGQIVLGTGFVRDEWGRAGFDLATDAWLVVDGAEAVVGYAQAMREEPAVVESEPFGRWAEEQTGSPSYDPTLWLLAKAGGSRSAPSPGMSGATAAGSTTSGCWRPAGAAGPGRRFSAVRSPSLPAAGSGA
jgi:hypothetical protein